MNPGIARMVVISAFPGVVSEAPLAKLLEDDRLPRMLPEIDSCVQIERDRVLSIAYPILEMLCCICDATASELVDQMSHAVAVQISYAEHRIRLARHCPTWEHSFRNQWTMRFSDDGVFAEDCEVEVLTDISHCGGGLLCSDSAWQPLAALMRILPI